MRPFAQAGDPLCLRLRMAAPENEHAWFIAGRNCCNAGVGDGVPSSLGVAAGLGRLDRQGVIKQQHALPRPFAQIAMIGARHTKVRFQFLVDVHQARRDLHPFGDGKAQPHGLTRTMIGILPQDHDLHLVQRRQFERFQPAAAGRVDLFARLFFSNQKPTQLPGLCGRQDRFKYGLPAFGDRFACHDSGTRPIRLCSPAPLPTNPQSA